MEKINTNSKIDKNLKKEIFLKVLENAPECDDKENQELLEALNSMSEEDKEIVSSEVVKW